jgi:translocator protein
LTTRFKQNNLSLIVAEGGKMVVLDIIKLIVSIAICEGAGGIGAIFTIPAIPQWYATLKKPSLTPPRWAFGPVWGVLYLLMAIALFFVWKQGLAEPGILPAFIIFWVQLVLNVLWSFVFFGRKSLFGGVLVILLLWIAILLSIIAFFNVSLTAGILMIPYILWVSIAANLNIQVWRLNR